MESSRWDTHARSSRSRRGSRRASRSGLQTGRSPCARPSNWSTPSFIPRARPGAGTVPIATSRVSRKNCPRRSEPKSRSSRAKRARGNWSSAIRVTITWTTSCPSSAASGLFPNERRRHRKREIHGRAPRVAPRRHFPHPLLDLLRPGGLCPRAGTHLLRSELELRRARVGATPLRGFQTHFHRRKAGRGGARPGRLDKRGGESLRSPGRAVLPEASRQRRGVHVSLPPVDL